MQGQPGPCSELETRLHYMRPCFKQTEKKQTKSQVWWHAVLISTLGRLRQEDYGEFKSAWAID